MTAPDFGRLMDPTLREHFVYRTFDADGGLLYVGCSIHPEKRLREHKMHGRWHHLMARVRLAGPYSYHKARELERVAIRTEQPRFNGMTPEAIKAKREKTRFVDEHVEVAIQHGETHNDAIRLAVRALDSMTPTDSLTSAPPVALVGDPSP